MASLTGQQIAEMSAAGALNIVTTSLRDTATEMRAEFPAWADALTVIVDIIEKGAPTTARELGLAFQKSGVQLSG